MGDKKIMEEFDWTEQWKKSMEESSWGQRAEKPEFWDTRVDQFEEMIEQSNRAGMILSRIETKEDYTVLDTGAGPGAVAIPLAKTVKHVAVVEPSKGMLACLKEHASKHKLSNITYINNNTKIKKSLLEESFFIIFSLLLLYSIPNHKFYKNRKSYKEILSLQIK